MVPKKDTTSTGSKDGFPVVPKCPRYVAILSIERSGQKMGFLCLKVPQQKRTSMSLDSQPLGRSNLVLKGTFHLALSVEHQTRGHIASQMLASGRTHVPNSKLPCPMAMKGHSLCGDLKQNHIKKQAPQPVRDNEDIIEGTRPPHLYKSHSPSELLL